MDTTLDYALNHCSYLQSFAPAVDLDWVYNCSHGKAVDLLEILTLNYNGYSPNTASYHKANWVEFHEDMKDHPNAKYFQLCHSQDAIHVRNALINSPQEIRDRIIVLAIAPGAIIPDELCFQSFNYACRGDPVPLGELITSGALDTNEYGISRRMEQVLEYQKELIVLERHPDSQDIGHSFQDPTFREVIKKHVDEYLVHNGEYENPEGK